MIGPASIMSPIVDGTVNRNASRMPRESSERNAVIWPATTSRDSSGSVTVPSATPNRPSGNCMSRNAIESQNIGPSPRVDANIELTRTFTCVVPLEIGAKSIAQTRQRWQLDAQLQRAADQRADGEPDQCAGPEMRINPGSEHYAAHDRTDIEKARSHGRHAEHALGVEHAHDQRGQGNQQYERKHDARELRGQCRLVRLEARRNQRH